jgi:tetratricopeptide (TPR) repeat protein
MSKYNIDLDYTIPLIDISKEELNEIIAEADKIISDCGKNPKELAVAYLKKAQCLQKIEQCAILASENDLLLPPTENSGTFIFTIDDKQEQKEIKGLLEKALELSPEMPEALMRLGITYGNITNEEGNIDTAINLLTRAIQLKPDYAAAFHNRSNVIHKLGGEDNIKKAIADLSEAIHIRPFDALYYYTRANRYTDLAMYEKAIEDLSSAINYSSNAFKKTVRIFLKRGKKYMELEEYGKAADDFTESLNLEKDHVNTLLMRGKAYYLAGEKDKAKADIEEYLSRKRKSAYDAGREEIFKHIGVMPEGIL